MFETPEEGKAFMDEWMESPGINISRTVYHGSGIFIGNMVTRLLAKVENLQIKLHQHLSQEKLPLADLYVKAFQQFRAVVDSCFGQSLTPGYQVLIKTFMDTYRSLNISIPLKVH